MSSNDEQPGATSNSVAHDGVHANGATKSVAGTEQSLTADNSTAAADTIAAALDPTPATSTESAAAATPASTTLNTTPAASPDPTSSFTSTTTPTPFPSDAALLSHLQSHLSDADLNIVTTKTIIAHLQTHFQHDLSSKKAMIKAAINDFMNKPHTHTAATDDGSDTQQPHDGEQAATEAEAAAIHEPEEAEEEEEQQMEESQEDLDHRLAMELAAESGRPRRTAAAGSIKRAEKRKLKESNTTTSSSTKKPKNKSNKPPTLYSLSPALSAFLPDQPSHMSWGDVVKQLWGYFRLHKLQDEKNKKRIILDEALQSVFGKDRKTMDAFKMNTLLTKHMKKQDELA